MIFEGQTNLKITVDLDLNENENIAGATALIKYIKPDGSTGSFSAIIEDIYDGIIYYDVQLPTEIVGVGKWILWAHITFADGRTAPGEPFTMEVVKEGAIC